MTYQETLNYIFSVKPFSNVPSLERIRLLLDYLGNPQDKLKFVHVAGTNGKGTCSTIISQIMIESNFNTALFSSPFVEDFRERFRINSEMISKEELVKITEEVIPFADKIDNLNQFEFITAIAMKWFCKMQCDVVVLEVGLGGRFDATNIIDNTLVSVIMSISLDHVAVLGSDIAKIACEKGGIIKKDIPTVLYPIQEKSTFDVVSNICNTMNSNLHIPKSEYELISENLLGSTIRYKEDVIRIPFSGEHQIFNTITALKAVETLQNLGYRISKEAVISGVSNAKISARTELVRENPVLILDGGHNEGGAIALKKLVEKHLKNEKIHAVIGIMCDKDSKSYIDILSPLFSKITFINIDCPRAEDPKNLKIYAETIHDNVSFSYNLEKLIDEIIEDTSPSIICGSMFLAGEARTILRKKLNL